MDKQKNKNSQNRSMFLYTALIFAVALVFIILAFFGQTNISNLRRSADLATSPAAASEEPDQTTVTDSPEELARLGNAVSALEAENSSLKKDIEVYSALINANARISENNPEEAAAELEKVNYDLLSSEEKMLYEQTSKRIDEKLNKGEEK